MWLGKACFREVKHNPIYLLQQVFEPRHEISNIVVFVTSQGSDQPAHTHSLIRAFCLSLKHSMSVKLLKEHHLEFLSLKGGCTGSYVSTLNKIQHCWKSHVPAQSLIIRMD